MIDEVADEPADDMAAMPGSAAPVASPGPLRTGNEAVDGVLETLEHVSELPLGEQVAVFERAHEQLRAALDGPRD